MMTNLFSIFDPISSLQLNWCSLLMGLLFLTSNYWLIKSKASTMILTFTNWITTEMKTILSSSTHQMNLAIMNTFMFSLLMMNFISLFPYIFNPSSHMSVTLSLAMPLWTGLMVFGWVNFTTLMFAHLVPQSTPTALMPFMVSIETISSLIRPLTLSIRLAANMIAGHLLITLLANLMSSSAWPITLMCLVPQLALLILEVSVSVIQSYVFTVLMSLYISEI